MLFRILAIAFIVLVSSCRSGEIRCPEIIPGKLKKSNPFSLVHRKRVVHEATASSRTYNRHSYAQLRADKYDDKKTINVEDWDCPRPGSAKNQKLIKEHRKKLEKQNRLEEKRKREIDPYDSVIPDTADN